MESPKRIAANWGVMGFRFRKSIKIAKGVRLNLSKRGLSTSFGGKGFTMNVGSRGVRGTVGIPGTGLSYSANLTSRSKGRRSSSSGPAFDSAGGFPQDFNVYLDDAGKLQVEDQYGAALSRGKMTQFRAAYGPQIEALYAEFKARENATTDIILDIQERFLDIPSPADWVQRSQKQGFRPESFSLTKPSAADFVLAGEKAATEKLQAEQGQGCCIGCFIMMLPIGLGVMGAGSDLVGFLVVLSPIAAIGAFVSSNSSYKTKHVRVAREEAAKLGTAALTEWQTSKRLHEEEQTKLRDAFEEAERARLELLPRLLAGDVGTLQDTLELASSQLEFHYEFSVSLKVVSAAEVFLDIDLPEIEEVPTTNAVSRKDGKVSVKDKSLKVWCEQYARLVHGLLFWLTTVVFDNAPTVSTVMASGYTQRRDASTGRDVDTYILAARFEKGILGEMDLQRIDTLKAIEKFEHKRHMTKDFAMVAIEPFSPGAEAGAPAPSAAASPGALKGSSDSERNVPTSSSTGGAYSPAVGFAPLFNSPSAQTSAVPRDDLWETPGEPKPVTHAIPRPPAGIGDSTWVPQGTTISVRGFDLPGGMLYHGTRLKAPNGIVEPALIDPRLPVASEPVDESERLTDYWPSYSDITPAARRAYLQWLASGRSNPEVNIGYVFLFFYGLERRALIDLEGKPNEEFPLIVEEVERLLGVYGANHSFRGYASRFISLLSVIIGVEAEISDPPNCQYNGYELPLELRVALGGRAKGEIPIDANWARVWALADPNLRKRTPIVRCEAPFKALFAEKFDTRFPTGMPLPKIKTRLRSDYHPASGGLRGVSAGVSSEIPDVTASTKPGKVFQPLLDQCADELDAFSRYVGRNPGQEESLDAILQLPSSLWPASARSQLDDLRETVQQGILTLSFGELSGKFNAAGALNKDKTLAFARALEAQQVGMEPDVLTGAKIPKPEDQVVLFFASSEEGSVRTTPAYQAAAISMGLAHTVAMADGEFSDDEEAFLKNRVENWPDLSVAHRKRLQAHLQLQKFQPASLASYKKRLEPLDAEARRALAKFLAHLAQADGTVSTKEVKLLEKIYATLGIDQQLVFTDLHRAPSSPLEGQPPTGVPPATGFSLDHAKIAELQKETAQVSSLLAQVFSDDDDAAVPPEPPCETGLLGLDEEHSSFLRLLFSRTSWSREEVEGAASDIGLMVDGALERINEAGMEHFEELVIEGDEPLEVNQDVMERVLAE